MKDQKINSSNDISINQKVYRKEIGDLYANFDTERSHNKKMHRGPKRRGAICVFAALIFTQMAPHLLGQ